MDHMSVGQTKFFDSMQDGSIRILSGKSLFDPTPAEIVLPAQGKTIAETLLELRKAGAIDPLFLNDDAMPLRGLDLTVWVSDWDMNHAQIEIPVANWHRVRVKPGMSLAIAIRPQGGGGGGGKSPVRILLTIVVIAVAIYTGGAAAAWAGAPTGGGLSATAAAAVGAAASAGVSQCGSLCINRVEPDK